MRPYILLLIALLPSVSVQAPAHAQVTLNLDAIEPTPAKPQSRPRPASPQGASQGVRPQTRPATSARPHATAAQSPVNGRNGQSAARATAAAAAAATAATAITLPVNPPPTATLAPPAAPLTNPAPPPRPIPIATASSTVAASATDSLRIVFPGDKSDLSADAITALEQFAKSAPANDAITFNVAAYAAGNPEDPSTPRRLALARALAIRTALMADGIASARIYVRAHGVPAQTTDGPADRVDVAILGRAAAQASVPWNVPSGVPPSIPPAKP